MLYSLRGKLIHTTEQTAAVECGGVAFLCSVSMNTIRSLPPKGAEVTLYTHLNVREDALDLFGFYEREELDMFRLLTSVNGVGPKAALSILSQMTPDRLCVAIAGGDYKIITTANGVGPKIAQRIVMELREKVGNISLDDNGDIAAAGSVSASKNASEAVEALTSLGYSQSEASLAVGKQDGALPVEELIKNALKALSSRI